MGRSDSTISILGSIGKTTIAFGALGVLLCFITGSPALTAAGAYRTPKGLPFDIVVNNGQTLIIDTNTQQLTDANGQTLTFENGDIFVDSLFVNAGGKIVGQGPNSLRFFAANFVVVQGTIDVSGKNATNVSTLLTAGVLTQPGGKGTCGGGDGGTGNPDTTQSSAKGGAGFGPKNVALGGGDGGESSLVNLSAAGAPCFESEDRQPAGGGGGSFTTLGEAGFDGTNTNYTIGACSVANGKSAVDPLHQPKGGAPGPLPFSNASALDNYLGYSQFAPGVASGLSGSIVLVSAAGPLPQAYNGRYVGLYRKNGTWNDGSIFCLIAPNDESVCPKAKYVLSRIVQITGLGEAFINPPTPVPIQAGDQFVVYCEGGATSGELSKLRGGEGGGAGGNNIENTTFPNPNYAFQDKSGAGGGGGGGILEIYCYGSIDIGSAAILARGGNGAAGENSIGLDRVAGGSGGGSGGMIRIQTAAGMSITSATIAANGGLRGPGLNDGISDALPPSTADGLGHGGRGGKGILQLNAPVGADGNPVIVGLAAFVSNPSPILGIPEFTNDSARQRALWYGIK
jgi:hypothetical protein